MSLFESPLVEWIVIVFMLLAGISFVQHYRLFVERRVRRFVTDFEVRACVLIALATIALIAPTLFWQRACEPARAVRTAAFQLASILTTTGFGTDDFEHWHPLGHVILLGLMLVGG